MEEYVNKLVDNTFKNHSFEEEKKAIEYYNGKEFSFTLDIPEDKMQEFKKALGITDNEEDSFESHQIRIQTLLKLISKLQKENEYLREREEYLEKRRSDIINTFQNKVTGTTIPKDKIKELRGIDNIDYLQFRLKELLDEGGSL